MKRRNGNQHLHRKPAASGQALKRKLHADHVFVQAGCIAQGLARYLAACHLQRHISIAPTVGLQAIPGQFLPFCFE